jgi:hypothetical protein
VFSVEAILSKGHTRSPQSLHALDYGRLSRKLPVRLGTFATPVFGFKQREKQRNVPNDQNARRAARSYSMVSRFPISYNRTHGSAIVSLCE